MTTREEWIRGMSRSDMLANLTARRDQAAEKVKQLVRDVDDWNRRNLNELQQIDDAGGGLRAVCRLVGLDLDTLIVEARA
jgi:hypothetical protein